MMASLETKFKREFSFKDVEGGLGLGGGAIGGGEDPYGGGSTTGGAWSGGRDYLDF